MDFTQNKGANRLQNRSQLAPVALSRDQLHGSAGWDCFLGFQDDVEIRRPCGGFLHFDIYASQRGGISFMLFFTSIGAA